jgi:hypothetical protein
VEEANASSSLNLEKKSGPKAHSEEGSFKDIVEIDFVHLELISLKLFMKRSLAPLLHR